ncbi:MAG TPA: peptidoglycan-associated lipoprotein Pal [Geomonas sp.]|nr:peptidoglycan-associated lipoprotein Pal [Geomonas sp.]
MRRKIIATMVALCVGAFLAGGCAKKEIVKTEEPAPSVQKQAPAPAPETKPTTPEQQAQPLPETPTREAVIQPEAPKETAAPAELQSELQKIYFNFDSSDLSQQSRDTLSKNAELMAKNPSVKIRIEGNCDERGSDEYNLALGERRAKAARDYLVRLGVAAGRLSVISYGEEKPVDPGHDEAAWSKNRRDEFVIVK